MSLSYSDDDLDITEAVRSDGPSAPTHATKESSKSSNTGVIAGAVLAGVGIAAAVGARFIFNKKKPTESSSKPLSARGEGRRTIPPRRARSTASGASSIRQR